MSDDARGDDVLVVLRCSDCGDTFAATEGTSACRSCGGRRVDPAAEPLL
ncbi:MAG TPA: hypothetical protein VM573_03560 [Actinomycetota bacterium]|jgi:rRNA maturation endonuclease Nob1|nr:hypothetical protein [Actinomycetota bacterium]